MFWGKKILCKGNDEIIFFDIKQHVLWHGEQIDGGCHVMEMTFFFYIDFKIF